MFKHASPPAHVNKRPNDQRGLTRRDFFRRAIGGLSALAIPLLIEGCFSLINHTGWSYEKFMDRCGSKFPMSPRIKKIVKKRMTIEEAKAYLQGEGVGFAIENVFSISYMAIDNECCLVKFKNVPGSHESRAIGIETEHLHGFPIERSCPDKKKYFVECSEAKNYAIASYIFPTEHDLFVVNPRTYTLFITAENFYDAETKKPCILIANFRLYIRHDVEAVDCKIIGWEDERVKEIGMRQPRFIKTPEGVYFLAKTNSGKVWPLSFLFKPRVDHSEAVAFCMDNLSKAVHIRLKADADKTPFLIEPVSCGYDKFIGFGSMPFVTVDTTRIETNKLPPEYLNW